MNKFQTKLQAALLGAAVAGSPGLVVAQVLEEVIVSAQKRAQSVQEVPIAISALSAQGLEKANVTLLEDLNNAVSGFNMTTVGGYTVPTIRSMGTAQVGSAVYMGSTTYVDGVYQPRSYTGNLVMDNVESIQVLKGPQGALYGRNSTGGAIVVETRNPEAGGELTGSLKLGVGDFNSTEASGWISSGLSDSTGFILQAQWSERDGYHDFAAPPSSGNLVGRDDFAWMERQSIGGKFLFETDNFSIILNASFSEQDSGEQNYDNFGDEEFLTAAQISQISPPLAPLAPLFEANNLSSSQIILAAQLLGFGLPPGDRDTPFTAIGIASGLSNSPEFGVINANLQASCEFDAPSLDGSVSGLGCTSGHGYNLIETENYGATLEANLSMFDLVSITSYQDVKASAAAEVGDYDANTPGAQTLALLGLTNVGLGFTGEFVVDNIQQELRLVSNDTWGWDWIVGANYFKETSDFHGIDGNAFGGVLESVRNDWENTSVSVFAQATFPITDNLSATLGGRYLRDELQLNDNINLGSPIINPTTAAVGSAGNLERDDNEFTYTARLEYSADGWMIYGGVSTGFKSSNFNADGPTFGVAEPEEIDAYEIGWKSEFLNQSLQVNGAVFFYDYTNPHIGFVDNATGGQVLLNIPSGDLFGAELDLKGLIGERISWYANMTVTDSEYNEDAAFFNASANLTSTHASAGKEFAGASKFAMVAGIDVEIPVGDVGSLFITPSVRYNDGIWYDAENRIGSGGTNNDGFTVANLNVKLQSNSAWSVGLWAKNLFDEQYVKNGLQANGFLLPSTPSDPRTFGATLTVDF